MRVSRPVVVVTLAAALAVGVMAIQILRPRHSPRPVRTGTSPAPELWDPASITKSPVKGERWDREAAAANLLLLFSGGGAWDPDFTEAMKALGATGVREVIRRLVQTRNSPPRDRDDPGPRGGVDAESILPLLQILSQLKNPVPGLAQEILAWAESGHAVVYNRQIVAALAGVGGPEEGGRAAGALAIAELERLRARPERGQLYNTQYLLREIPRHGLTGAEETLLKLSDLHGSGLGLISEDPSIPQEIEEAVFKALARLDTSAGAQALAASVHELADPARRESVLAAIAETAQEKPQGKMAVLLQEWASPRLLSSSASTSERMAAYAVAAGMGGDTIRQLCSAHPPDSEERLFAAWLEAVVTAAARNSEAASLCGKLIEGGAIGRPWVSEDLSRKLIHAYVAGDSVRRRHVMSLVSTATAIEALAIVLAFPGDAWKEDRNFLKGTVERFHRAEEGVAAMAAQFAADRWLDAAENKSEGLHVMQAMAPNLRLGRRHTDPDFAPPANPSVDDLTRLGGILRDAPKRRELIGNVKAIAENAGLSVEAVARTGEAPGLTCDFLFALARGLLARKSPESRAAAEALLAKVAPGPWVPPVIEIQFWKCIVLLAVRDEQGRMLAWKCLEARETSTAPRPASLVPKLEALRSFVEKCRESN